MPQWAWPLSKFTFNISFLLLGQKELYILDSPTLIHPDKTPYTLNVKWFVRLLPRCWDGISIILTFSLYPWPPFLSPSVIWNNLRASLDSIHQSRKKQALTLIKKKYHLCLAGVKGVRENETEKKGEGLQMKQALLSPSCPPSSMPFQLKSAVVIKFQQGLGATVWRTDGGLPWHKDDTIQEDRGGARRERREGDKCCVFTYTARIVLLNLPDI